jgi:Transposase DNA-binding
MACQDWANTKAAYRFFSNKRVDEGGVLEGHFQATHDRFGASDGTVLVLHNTTEFSFQRESPDRIGITYNVNSGPDKAGRVRAHTVCGRRNIVLFFSSLLEVNEKGSPL